jgi:hypothetical protein
MASVISPTGQLRLRDYPFVVIRFACRDCPRIGRYRLAVLAERFGADALLPDVLEAISAACPRTRERHPSRRCQAYLPDLTEPRPPDLPVAAGRRLGVVSGGKV